MHCRLMQHLSRKHETAHISLLRDRARFCNNFCTSWSLTQISSITRANARFAAVGHSTIQHAFSDCPACPLGPSLLPSSRYRAGRRPRAPPPLPSINDVTRRRARARERQIEEKSPFHSSSSSSSSSLHSYDDIVSSLDSPFAAIDCDDLEGERDTERQAHGTYKEDAVSF